MCRCYICNKRLEPNKGAVEEICNKCIKAAKELYTYHSKEYEHAHLERPFSSGSDYIKMDGTGFYFDWH